MCYKVLPCPGEPHISRAASSVGVMYRISGPNTGSNSGGGRILKKKWDSVYTYSDQYLSRLAIRHYIHTTSMFYWSDSYYDLSKSVATHLNIFIVSLRQFKDLNGLAVFTVDTHNVVLV